MKELVDAFEGLFAAASIEGGEVAEAAGFALEKIDWNIQFSSMEPASHPIVDRQLEIACSNSGQYGSNSNILAKALLSTHQQLRWFSMYGDREDEPDFSIFLRNYTGSCVIGKDGIITCDEVAAGFTLQGRDIYYPPHAHQAEESYWIIGGNGDWKVGAEPWFPVEAGNSVHHTSGVRHAMQTNAMPMLSIWLWTSHLDSEVAIVRG